MSRRRPREFEAHSSFDERAALASGLEIIEADWNRRWGVDRAIVPEAVERLIAYLRLLERWNESFNLTGFRSNEQAVVDDLLDSAVVLGPLLRWSASLKTPSEIGLRIVDVGSGAGLPGIVLALCNPSLKVTCIDASAKKSSFLRQVAAEICIPNVTIRHQRVETVEGGAFDVAVSRAFASLADFAALTQGCVRPGGAWLAMKGQVPHHELAQLPSALNVFHVEHVVVPGSLSTRCLIWIDNVPKLPC